MATKKKKPAAKKTSKAESLFDALLEDVCVPCTHFYGSVVGKMCKDRQERGPHRG